MDKFTPVFMILFLNEERHTIRFSYLKWFHTIVRFYIV